MSIHSGDDTVNQPRKADTAIDKIVVMGFGGAGIDAVDRMLSDGLSGVRTAVVCKDGMRLDASRAAAKILVGEVIDSEKVMADERIKGAVRDAALVFLLFEAKKDDTEEELSPIRTAVVAASEVGATVVNVIMAEPETGVATETEDDNASVLSDMFRYTDSFVFIAPMPIRDAVVCVCALISGVAGVVLRPGSEEMSIDDVRRVFYRSGTSIVGIGEANGDYAAIEAARAALASRCIDAERSIEGATRIMVCVVTGPNTERAELENVLDVIWRAKDDDIRHIMWGHSVDPNMGDAVRVIVIACDFDDMKDRRAEMRSQVTGYLERVGYLYSDAIPDRIKFGFNLKCRLSQVEFTLKFGNDGYIAQGFLPLKVQPEFRDEVMRFITMVNFNLRIGNFDIDLDDGEISFRTFTCYEGMVVLSDAVINQCIEITVSVIEDYGDALIDVMMGYKDAVTAYGLDSEDRG